MASAFNEDAIIEEYFRESPPLSRTFLDIGGGIQFSNTVNLFKNGWSGIAVDNNPEKYMILEDHYKGTDVMTSCLKITPENVRGFLSFKGVDYFDFLSIDIDGYDVFVVEEILKQYSPELICMEINETIPPPIRFAIKYSEEYCWGLNSFFGCSIMFASDIMKKYGYGVHALEFNNVFFSKKGTLDPVKAYKVGYYERMDRKMKFKHNECYECVFNMHSEGQMEFFNKIFSQYEGKYIIYAGELQ